MVKLMEDGEVVHLRIRRDVLARVRILANRERRSVQETIRILIERGLEKEKPYGEWGGQPLKKPRVPS